MLSNREGMELSIMFMTVLYQQPSSLSLEGAKPGSNPESLLSNEYTYAAQLLLAERGCQNEM